MIRAVAIAATGAALAVAAWQLPRELRSYDNAAAAAAARQSSRELPVAATVGIDPAVFARAAKLLPRDAIFYVAVPNPADLPELVFQSLAPYALLPRRHTTDAAQARWVLAYHRDPRSLGLRLERVFRLGPDVAAAEVAR